MTKKVNFIWLLVCTFFLVACQEEKRTISGVPMFHESLGAPMKGGPWPVTTYDDEKIKFSLRVLRDGKEYTDRRTVYINKDSQFVFKDGKPIITFDGRPMYWNSQGYIVNDKLQKINESLVFELNSKPLKDGTPLEIQYES